jgi:hypothetical protein
MQEQQNKNCTHPESDSERQDSVHNVQVSPKEAFDSLREQFHHIFDAIEDVNSFVAKQRGR